MSRESIASSKVKKFVGKCIYCGSTENLHDEHCIPESLQGFHVLEKGSCADCGKITTKFECAYARDSILAARTALGMRSKRSKSKRPTAFPMTFQKGEVVQEFNVPVAEHFSLITLIDIGPPGAAQAGPNVLGLRNKEYRFRFVHVHPTEHVEYLMQKYDADSVSVDFQLDINGFLRLIAKIAYCQAVYQLGIQNIRNVCVIPAILGESNDIWQWVGSDGTQELYET